MFDKSKNSWKFHCSLKSKRSHHGFTVLKDALFITGGYDGSYLASSEYIYANGTVESGPNLPEARHEQCMVTLHDGKVMILGYGNTGCGGFQTGDTKLARFLPKNQQTQWKLLNFEFWINGELSNFQSKFSMSKIIRIYLKIFFH